MNEPLVTAIMPTSGTPLRRKLARIAVECFQNQTYPNRQLLILNHGETLALPPQANIREVLLQRPATLGELRNQAFQYLREGDYAISWDDDDWHGPDRIGIQYAHTKMTGLRAAALSTYVNVDVHTGDAFVRSCKHFKCGNCCGTLLYEIGKERYPQLDRREDSDFAMRFKNIDQLVDCAAPPTVYIRLCHGENTSGAEHIMRGLKYSRRLEKHEKPRVRNALLTYAEAGCFPRVPNW